MNKVITCCLKQLRSHVYYTGKEKIKCKFSRNYFYFCVKGPHERKIKISKKTDTDGAQGCSYVITYSIKLNAKFSEAKHAVNDIIRRWDIKAVRMRSL